VAEVDINECTKDQLIKIFGAVTDIYDVNRARIVRKSGLCPSEFEQQHEEEVGLTLLVLLLEVFWGGQAKGGDILRRYLRSAGIEIENEFTLAIFGMDLA